MPKYDIKRGTTTIASVIAEGSQNVEAMGVNEVNMKFTLINPVVFQVGDWCTVYGNTYIVYRKPEYTKVNERQHEYDLYLVHEFYKLQDSLLMGIDKNAILNEKVFDLTGNLQAFADLVLANANRNDTGWTLGTVDSTDAKTMQFDGENILASLNRIASEFETEFWIEGKTISFAKRLTNSGITLSYGENKGLISLTKGNKDANATIFTRLFVEGSEKNLPSYTQYGYKRLQLPASYGGKVDNTSAIASFGVIEHYAKFDDIYPKHTGTITSVGDEFTFFDTALPFDVNAQLLPGVTAYVAFQTGLLAGYNFDISTFDNATKKFVINENEDEKTTTLPNATLKPAVGDKYIVFDIQMPATHITTAENELLAKATELLAQGSDIDFNDAFSGNCDPLYFKRNEIVPVLGQYARLFETNPAIDVTKRMSRISRDLQNEWKYDITFTDKIQVNTVVREYIKNIEETLVINETKDRTIINRDAVRRAAQRIDILRGDVFDPDGYFDGTHLKPETIEAIMATFGYKSGSLTLEGVAFSLNVGGVANNFNITSGKLIHFAYDIGGDYTWVMGSMTSSFADSAQGYYIYAKISKTALTGSWVVNNSKLQVDNEVGYYTLLIGRVYPVTNGKREVDLLYGVTNIVGNRIQTGIIQDLAGTNFWNLDTGEMRVSGQITVGAGSNVYTKPETDAVAGNKNFTAAPSEYKVGDTWTLQADLLLNGIQYKAGDVLTTLTASATFVSAHWAKRDRYIGQENVNALVQTAKIRYIRDWARHVLGSDYNYVYYSIKAKRNDVDYAQGIPVANLTSNTFYGVLQGAYIVDGNDATYGYLNHGFSYYGYIQLDLGELREIDVIEILKYPAETQDGKKTEVSADGINWTTVYDPISGGGSVLGKTTIKMAGVNALMSVNKSIPETAVAYSSVASIRDNNFRYVRVMCFGEINNYPQNIRELEVYSGGVNVALGKPVTSTPDNITWASDTKVTDGDLGHDASFFDGGDWVNVDLQSSFAIDTIRVLRRTYEGQQYKNRVECSKDNITWYSIADDSALGRWVGGDTYYSVKSPGQQSAEQKTRLDEWANDGSISPAEKTALKELQAQITKDKDDLVARANLLSLATTNFTNAWSAFNTDLTALTAATPETIVILTAAPSYTINRDAYYNQRNTLEAAIETANQNKINAKVTFFTGSAPSFGTYKVNDLWKPSFTMGLDGTTFTAGEVYRCTSTAGVFGSNWKIDKTVGSGATLPDTATAKTGDQFIHTGDSNKLYIFNGSSWVVGADTRIQTAINDAANALAANEFVDGRRTNNDNPTWYLTNYPRKTRKEFKELNAIGIYGYGTYGGLTTIIPYSDSSAGWVLITQEVTVSQRTFTRTAVDATNWSSWIDLKAETDAANALVPTFMGSATPSNPKTGSKWFDTGAMKWKEWNGTAWTVMADSDSMTAQWLRDAFMQRTDLLPGVLLTSVIGVRNADSEVTAYVNGNGNAHGTGIAFAAGVTNFAAYNEAQIFAIKHNGDIVIQKSGSKKLEFIASTGALTISGTVNATAGSIGGFTIESDKLKSATPAWETEALVLNKTANTFEFYSGYQTDDGTQYGNIIPDIKIQAVQGFKDILSNPVGEIYCGGFYALPTRYSTVVGGNGISSNCSNIRFKPDKSESGKESNASIAARIKVDADKIGDSIYGFYSRRISAAIAGVTDLTQGSNDSRTYGGYFNSLFTGTFHTGVKEISSSSTFYLAGEFITTIYCASGASGAWLMFPSINHEEGRVLIVRNSSGGSVYISRTSSENLYLGDNSSVTTTTIGNKRTQIWQRLGNAWGLLIDQAF